MQIVSSIIKPITSNITIVIVENSFKMHTFYSKNIDSLMIIIIYRKGYLNKLTAFHSFITFFRPLIQDNLLL